MDIQGRIVQILPEVEGVSKAGNAWRKQEFILSTQSGQYERKVCITLFGDRVDQFHIAEGDEVRVGIDIESREFNGRWYTNVNGYRIDKIQMTDATAQPYGEAPYQAPAAQDGYTNPSANGFNQTPQSMGGEQFPEQEGDDLPF